MERTVTVRIPGCSDIGLVDSLEANQEERYECTGRACEGRTVLTGDRKIPERKYPLVPRSPSPARLASSSQILWHESSTALPKLRQPGDVAGVYISETIVGQQASYNSEIVAILRYFARASALLYVSRWDLARHDALPK